MKLSEKALKVKPSATLSVSAKINKMKADGIDIIDFCSGEPDFDTPLHIKQAAINAINDNFTKYTANSGIYELRKAISNKLKKENGITYNSKQIVVSNGSKQVLYNTFKAILNTNDEIIIPSPYWPSYPEMVKMTGGKPVIVKTLKENCFKVTKNELNKALTEKTKAIIINTPSNPSGMVYSYEELKEIAEFAVENDIFVISDEIYEKLIYSSKLEHISIASINDDIYKRTIVINGLSKSHAMTGWRVGYSASSEKIASVISNIQSQTTSNINSIAQKAAYAALTQDQQCVDNMVREFKHRRDYISQRISDIPLFSSFIPKGTFYLFADISKLCGNTVNGIKIKNAGDIAKVLVDNYGVAVTPCADFGAEMHIRISFAVSMEDIVIGIDRIEKFVKENYK